VEVDAVAEEDWGDPKVDRIDGTHLEESTADVCREALDVLTAGDFPGNHHRVQPSSR
jgi:hypothetical protein